MKFVHERIQEPLFLDDHFCILSVENPSFLRSFQLELRQQLDGFEGGFALSDGDKSHVIAQCAALISDPFDLVINDRRTLLTAHASLIRLAEERGMDIRLLDVSRQLMDFMDELIQDEPFFVMGMEQLNVKDCLKCLDVHLSVNAEQNYFDQFMDFLLIKIKFANKKLFVCNGLSAYITTDELLELQRFAVREDIEILVVEGVLSEKWQQIPIKTIIIDDDLCEIVK